MMNCEDKKDTNLVKVFGIKFFLTFGYVGFFPVIPGTAGSLVAVIPVLLLNFYLSYTLAQTLLAIAIVVFFFLGVVGCREYAQKIFGKEDPSHIVIDEVVGMWITLWLWDYTSFQIWGIAENENLGWIIGFLLFRFFDMTKIAGIKKLERIPQGWGVMLDDVAAGVLSFLILRLLSL